MHRLGTKILRVLCNPWENISARNICAHLCHLWEDISARGFCEFGEFCGRMQWLLGWCSGDHCTPWEGAWVWQGCHTLLQLHRLGGLKFCVFCAIRGKISQQEISVYLCAICGRISQQEVSVGSANSVGGYARFAWLVQWRPLHPLVECKKCIDFFVVTKFRCIFAM